MRTSRVLNFFMNYAEYINKDVSYMENETNWFRIHLEDSGIEFDDKYLSVVNDDAFKCMLCNLKLVDEEQLIEHYKKCHR